MSRVRYLTFVRAVAAEALRRMRETAISPNVMTNSSCRDDGIHTNKSSETQQNPGSRNSIARAREFCKPGFEYLSERFVWKCCGELWRFAETHFPLQNDQQVSRRFAETRESAQQLRRSNSKSWLLLQMLRVEVLHASSKTRAETQREKSRLEQFRSGGLKVRPSRAAPAISVIIVIIIIIIISSSSSSSTIIIIISGITFVIVSQW